MFAYLRDHGDAEFQAGSVVVAGCPVQFLPVSDGLTLEALTAARILPYDREFSVRVVTPEHLAAEAVKVGRPKEVQRFAMPKFDRAAFADVIARHGLEVRLRSGTRPSFSGGTRPCSRRAMEPRRPSHLDPLAEELLDGLTGRPEAAEIVIGGGVALNHYLDHRPTFDLDAWWRTAPNSETLASVGKLLNGMAERRGVTAEEARWGDVVSFSLRHGSGRHAFSFQIAERDLYLEPPVASSWHPVLLETLADNAASKMVALVDRGAPRDFVDVYALVRQNLFTTAGCWDLYRRKRPVADLAAAKLQVLTHLERLEARRPLEAIADPTARARAEIVRTWHRGELTHPRTPDHGC